MRVSGGGDRIEVTVYRLLRGNRFRSQSWVKGSMVGPSAALCIRVLLRP